MRIHDQPDITQLLAQLERRPDGEHRAALLSPLNLSLLTVSLCGLAVMLVPPLSNWYNYVLVGASVLINLLVLALNRHGRTLLASALFCGWVNLGLIAFFLTNLLVLQSLNQAILFAALLSLPVLLAGVLLGSLPSLIFVVANALSITAVFAVYYTRVAPSGRAFSDITGNSVPLVGFLTIVAVISWLYQRALADSEQKVSLARQRILRDELLRRDLAIARELQQRLYPPPPLTDANLRIASRSEPARETSGDFYDFIQLGEGRLGIVVADVTGKSLAAALVMAMARGTLRSEATRHAGPAAVLHSANETLCQDHSVKQMITAFYGVLDTRTLTLQISNAGHPFPVLRRDGRLEELEICGLPLGARPDARYTELTFQLQPGDQLVILSDGLIEEHNARRELFGFDRLNETIAAAADDDPEHALDDIWQAVARFRGDAEQSDDITLVVLQVAPALQMPASGAQLPQRAARDV